jgi:hypothetical protein
MSNTAYWIARGGKSYVPELVLEVLSASTVLVIADPTYRGGGKTGV